MHNQPCGHPLGWFVAFEEPHGFGVKELGSTGVGVCLKAGHSIGQGYKNEMTATSKLISQASALLYSCRSSAIAPLSYRSSYF